MTCAFLTSWQYLFTCRLFTKDSHTCHRNFSLNLNPLSLRGRSLLSIYPKLPEITKLYFIAVFSFKLLSPQEEIPSKEVCFAIVGKSSTSTKHFLQHRNTCCDYQSYFTIDQNVYLIIKPHLHFILSPCSRTFKKDNQQRKIFWWFGKSLYCTAPPVSSQPFEARKIQLAQQWKSN